MSKFHKYMGRTVGSFLLAVFTFSLGIIHGPPVYAVITNADLNSIAIKKTPNYKPDDCVGGTTPSSATSGGSLGAGKSVYILGDSITARTATTYAQKFGDKGITTTVSARVGRSWTGSGQDDRYNTGTQGTAKSAVDADAAAITNASGIIVALGTNGYQQQNPIDEIIAKLRGINASAPIWWVNVANGPEGNSGVPSFNGALDQAQAAAKIKVIYWSKVVDPNGDGTHNPNKVLDDGTHPSINDGVTKLADLVVGAIAAGNTTTPATNSTGATPAVCCSTASTASGQGTAAASTVDLNYTDTGRNNRSVGATAWLPADPTPRPLIIFVPGRDQNSTSNGFYKRYLFALANQGFVVVGANFTDNKSYEAIPTNADDINFLIGKLGSELKLLGRVNTAAGIGVVGHSDGAMVALLNGYANGKKSDKIKAVIAQDGALYNGASFTGGPPLLIMHGTADSIENISSSDNIYNTVGTPYSGFARFNGADHYQYITGPAKPGDGDQYDKFNPAVDGLSGAFMKRMLSNKADDSTKLAPLVSSQYSSLVGFVEKGDSNLASGNGGAAAGAAAPACQCSASSGSIPTAGENGERVFLYFVSIGLSKEQAAGITGNIHAESGFEPQIEQNKTPDTSRKIDEFLKSGNSKLTGAGALGYGLVQWTGYSQLDKMAEWARAHGKDPGSLDGQLSYIGYELTGEGGQPGPKKNIFDAMKATKSIDEAAAVWNVQYERSADSQNPGSPGWQKRIKFAHEDFDKYSNKAPGGGAGCSGAAGNSTQAQRVVQYALSLAWHVQQPQGKINKEDATPAYQAAMAQFNGSTGNNEWSDCGVFVATVMVGSGVDPNYAKRWTPAQLAYAKAHPEKYAILGDITSADQLQPGDIVINSHHTMIFVGQQPEGFNTVDASQGDRVPGAKIFGPHPSGEAYTGVRVIQ